MKENVFVGTRNVLHHDICTDAYIQVEKMIYQLCWRFQRKYGGDLEEWRSEAHVIFMECILSHEHERSNFITWLCNRITWHFVDIIRQSIKESKICFVSFESIAPKNNMDVDDFIPKPFCKPCFMFIIENASDPVRELWSIINYPPPELTDEIDPDDPTASWDALRLYLENHLKWPWTLIQYTIKELKRICS